MHEHDMPEEDRAEITWTENGAEAVAESVAPEQRAAPRKRTTGRRRTDDFDPTSRGDERGEVM